MNTSPLSKESACIREKQQPTSNNYYQIRGKLLYNMRVICEDCKENFASELEYELHRDVTGHMGFAKSD